MGSLSTEDLINALELEPHVEGGYYKRTFQADHREKVLTSRGPRFTLTSIYYLLTGSSPIGHWHVNNSDIIHYFHLGEPITYYLIHPDAQLEVKTMGPDPTQGQLLQMTVKGGTWKASHLASGNDNTKHYGLISEAVSPGFEFKDMTLGSRDKLMALFPQHQELIHKFSKDDK